MGTMNFRNRTLFHGDNLEFLRGINSETVDLIATDPPFNKGRDFHATPDSLAKGARFQDRWSWEADVHEEWVDSIKDDWPAVRAIIEASKVTYGEDIAAFLCFMGVRVVEMHRILKVTGSLYLHCDPTASHYLKALLDAIFGHKNFRNEIVWKYKYGGRSRACFGRKHDTVLYYVKSATAPFYEKAVRVAHEAESLAANYRKVDADGRRYREGTWKSGKKYRYYADEGRTCDDVWTDINSLHQADKERTGYPTQKPLALYERIIKASSDPGDIVLDPFCGCATTPIAAERLKRQWIGMDIWDGAHRLVLERLESEQLAVPEPKDRRHGEQMQLLTFGDVHYVSTPPQRSDENEVAAPMLKVKLRRPLEAWEKLSHNAIVEHLTKAQQFERDDLVICAGCGRALEHEFMELDHVLPRSDGGANDISNRILLCGPCNRRKSNALTLSGLVRENKKEAWMNDEALARHANIAARHHAERVRDEMSLVI